MSILRRGVVIALTKKKQHEIINDAKMKETNNI